MTNETRSAQTKAIILDLLGAEPGKSYSWTDMREKVDESLEITDGIFAGSVQALSHAGKIVKVERGVYTIATVSKQESSDSLSPKIIEILANAENSIRKEADAITILTLEETDFATIRQIQKLLVDLADLRTKFEENVSALNKG